MNEQGTMLYLDQEQNLQSASGAQHPRLPSPVLTLVVFGKFELICMGLGGGKNRSKIQ